MASNGIVFRPGRGPSFILVGLVVIVIILFYSYWGVSSKNNKLLRDVSVLQDRLRVLAARKLTADKKGSALVSQITQMQDEKEKVINSKDFKIAQMTKTLQSKEDELIKVREQEKQYQAELEKLKKGVNSSSLDLQNLKGKADELLKKYKELKESRSSLLEKVANLTAERDACQKELVQVKLELEQQKKSQDAKVLPSDKNVSDKTNDEKKANDEGQSVSDDSDKDTKESEKDDDRKDDKKDDKQKESEKDDESNNDENAGTPKEEKEKESLEVKSPVPSRASANQNNASVSRNIPENIKPDGNKSQTEETDKRNQSNPDNLEEVEKEAGKDEGNTEQPKEEDSREEDKDMDSQPVEGSDKKITDEENEEDEREKEESEDDFNERERTERSIDLAADMRRRMQPLPGKMTGNAQPAGNVEEIRNLERNPMDPQGLMSRRNDQFGISSKLEEMRRRKESEDQNQ